MTRSFRFFLFDMRWKLLTLVSVCLFLAIFYELTGGGEYSRYGESAAALLMMALMVVFTTLGAGGAPSALSLGGRRTDIFWGIQGCALVYALFTTLLMLAANAISGALGWPALGLNPAVLLFYPFACFGLSILGALAGLLASRLRWLAAVLLAFLVVLSLVLFLPLLIYSQDRFDTWGILPWFIPLLLALVWLAGEVFLYRELQRLCVR